MLGAQGSCAVSVVSEASSASLRGEAAICHHGPTVHGWHGGWLQSACRRCLDLTRCHHRSLD
jgi:hypothetical protein